MKKLFLLATMLLSVCSFALAQGDSTSNFKVYGNCESCKARIEKAAKAAGASKADWNIESKIMTVSFDPGKTSTDKILLLAAIKLLFFDKPKNKPVAENNPPSISNEAGGH